jgi:signal transduction histidine kinase
VGRHTGEAAANYLRRDIDVTADMNLSTAPLVVALLLGAAVSFGLGVFIRWRGRLYERVPGSTVATYLLVVAGWWMLTYAVELAFAGMGQAGLAVAANKVQYVGATMVPVFWLAYVLRYTGRSRLTRRRWALLLAPSLVTLALALTNGVGHHLVWEASRLDATGGFPALDNEHGPAFYVYTAWAWVLIGASFVLLGRQFVAVEGVYRRQVAGLLFGASVPTAGSVLYATGVNPLDPLNLPIVAFVVASLTVAWTVFHHRLFVIVPVARETAVEQMADGLIVLDATDRVVDANPTAERLLGDPEDYVGTELGRVLDRRGVDSLAGTDELTLTVDGASRHFQPTSSALTDDADAPIGRLVLLRDVTELREREAELRRQNERLDEFASVVSHDLRNPLGVAQGFVELARDDPRDDHLERAERALDRMEHIVDDLLAIAREGQALGDPEPVSLAAVAEAAVDHVETTDVDVRVETDRTVVAERDRLLQVFENLFRNSVEHASGGTDAAGEAVGDGGVASEGEGDAGEAGDGDGRVTVVVRDTDAGFEVVDDGVGFAEPARVLERGYTTRNHDGTGLGTTIVERVVEAHGWTLSVGESEWGGARFSVDVDGDGA